MKTYTWQMGDNIAAQYVATTDAPVKPTAENYRFDIKYNEEIYGGDSVIIEFYDADKKEWSSLAGTMADAHLYNLVRKEAEFKQADYVYYTLSSQSELSENTLIDVTPTQGEHNVIRFTQGL